MHPHKTLGPNGMNPFFFQKFWDTIDNDFSVAVFWHRQWTSNSSQVESYIYGTHPEEVKTSVDF